MSVADVDNSVGQVASDRFSVVVDGSDLIVGGDSQVQIFNAHGMLVYSGASGRISNLPSGILLVVTEYGSASILMK